MEEGLTQAAALFTDIRWRAGGITKTSGEQVQHGKESGENRVIRREGQTRLQKFTGSPHASSALFIFYLK